MQSTTSVLAASAPTTGPTCCRAVDAPVDRTTGPASNTVGTMMSKALQPILAAANRARAGSSGRLWLSLRMATVSPARRAQRDSTEWKASTQAGSREGISMMREFDP